MAEVTAIVTELKSVLSALAAIDQSSMSVYTPLLTTQKVALLIVPFEQSGAMSFAGLNGGRGLVHAHRIACEFWIKVRNDDTATAMQYGRDICLQAMRLVAANPTLNGSVMQVGSSLLGNQGMLGQYDVLPRYEERGTVTWIVARLWIPVEIREIGAW